MFDNITIDMIMDRMLAQIPDEFDKRVGSILWMALYPAALELRKHYIDLDTVTRNAFAQTADRKHLTMIAEGASVYPLPATATVVEARFNIQVPIGARFNKDKYNFVVREFLAVKDDHQHYRLESESVGYITDDVVDRIMPITTRGDASYVSDLKVAEIVKVLRPGENAEATEDFRRRYFRESRMEHYGGNIADYELMVERISGVGAVKVIPVWAGPGTVKLVVSDNGHNTPSQELIDAVKLEIDPTDLSGKGMGKAPINHQVTVEGVASVPMAITLPVTYETDHSWQSVGAEVTAAIEGYLGELRAKWRTSERLVVRISFIESRVIDVPGVLDCQNVLINGQANNVILGEYEIPTLGEVTAV